MRDFTNGYANDSPATSTRSRDSHKAQQGLTLSSLALARVVPGCMDFPGGHVEVEETPAAALVRELQEELGISIHEPDGPCLARLATNEFDLRVWLVTKWTGNPTNIGLSEHDEIGWFSESRAVGLRLALATYPSLITTALRLA